MTPALLQNEEPQGSRQTTLPADSGVSPSPLPSPPAEPAYLTRLATLPASLPAANLQAGLQEFSETSHNHDLPRVPQRPESARMDQIEHALTILASVVARLAKEAQQSRLQLRSTEQDPSLQEERRVQRELVRSMQARLTHIEERIERQNALEGRRSSATQPSPTVGAGRTAVGSVFGPAQALKEQAQNGVVPGSDSRGVPTLPDTPGGDHYAPEVAAQLAASLASIRDSLAALAQRRSRTSGQAL